MLLLTPVGGGGNSGSGAREDNSGGTQVIGNCSGAAYVENNGSVVIEAENLRGGGNWRKRTEVRGYKGSGYLEYYKKGAGAGEMTVTG